MSDESEVDHASFEKDFSDLHDGALAVERAREVESHIAGCQRCREEYERLEKALGALSGLHRLAAPPDFSSGVADTIHRRSAGRFFGRKAFGDRVPFELLAVIGLVLAIGLILLLRCSSTGSVHEPLRTEPRSKQVAPGARDVLPRP